MSSAALAQAPVVYVDPLLGVDQAGGGSSMSPLRSLTFAVAQFPAGPVTFRLRPGTFTVPQESFPIPLPSQCVVEADAARVPAGSELVQIDGQPLSLATILVVAGGNGPVDVQLRNLLLTGGIYRAVQVNGPAGTGTLRLLAEDCRFRTSREIAVNTYDVTQAVVRIERCQLDGVETPLLVSAFDTSHVDLHVDRTRIEGGMTSVDLEADTGSIAATFRAVTVRNSGSHGVRVSTPNQGTVALRVEHCLFKDIARRVVGPTPAFGAITENQTSAGTRTFMVENSLFAGNRFDCPHYNAATYTFGRNLIGQQSLVGVGGNILATPLFVDAAAGDFHLLAGSPGVDQGQPSAVTLATDLDGDPRTNPYGAQSQPDLGPDEQYDLYLALSGQARVGGPLPATVTLRGFAAPGSAFVAFGAAAIQPGLPWVPGVVHLLPPVVGPLFTGITGGTGVGSVPIPLPIDPSLLGGQMWLQGVFSGAPYIGINPLRVVLVR